MTAPLDVNNPAHLRRVAAFLGRASEGITLGFNEKVMDVIHWLDNAAEVFEREAAAEARDKADREYAEEAARKTYDTLRATNEPAWDDSDMDAVARDNAIAYSLAGIRAADERAGREQKEAEQ